MTALTEARTLTAELNRVLEGHATVETVEEDRALVDGDWADIAFTRPGEGACADGR